MKKNLLLKRLMIMVLLVGLSSAGWAQVSLPHLDAFDYTASQALQTQTGWTAVNTGDDISISAGNLSFSGLKTSSGNKISFAGSGIDAYKTFTTQSTGTVYASFILDVTNLGVLNTVGGYFTGFGQNSTTFGATVWTGLDGAGYKIGINPRTSTSANMVWVPETQTLNNNVFIVISYEYVTGSGNDIVKIWVNPSSSTFGTATPPNASATVSNISGTDLTGISQFFIRQDSDTETPTIEMDEYRVGLTWADVTPAATTTPTLTITAPVTGDKWAQGSTQTINWTASSTNADLMIEYTGNASDATPTWNTINPSIAANLGTWTLTLPADLPVGDDYKIRITDIPQTAQAVTGLLSITAAATPVATFIPAQGATNVSISDNQTITFDVAVRNIDDTEITDANVASLVTLKTTDAAGTAVPFTATIDAAKKVITINPDADLANEQLYYLAIAPVEGLSNNASLEQSVTFTTAASLVQSISDVTITETGPYYAGNQVTINWVSKNVTDVKVEAWVPSENKWQEFFASTPSDGTETFSIPADAQYSTEYKLRITDVANPLITTEGTNFTIIAVVNDLASLRAQPLNSIVKYTGIATVTFSQASRNQKYIQDATAAVLIDDPNPGFIGAYNVGEGITNIEGKILFYHELLEFTPMAATGEHAIGTVIVPEVRTLASLTKDDQGKLVKIENFAFKTPNQWDAATGLFIKSKNYDIEGQDNLLMAYRTAFPAVDYIGTKVPTGPISSICIVGQFDAQMQITSRSLSDMTIPTSIAVTSPIGGESYVQGSTQTITWTATNFTGDVKIELTGSNPLVIEASVANTGSYTWNIPDALGVATDYKVKISDAVDGDPMGESAATFSIIEKPFVLPSIVITEIMYTSPDVSTKQEWVELYNNGTTSVDMEGFYILDSDPLHKADPIVLPAGAVLAPGKYYTIETSDDGKPELFPFVPDFKSIKFNFGKADEVKIFHKNGQLIDSVSYNSVDPWPTSPNGGGSSLTLCDPNLDNSLASSWEASEDAFTTLQGTTIKATPGSGCVLHTAISPNVQNGITVYPNPTSDILYISNPANELFDITILSSIGKPVKSVQSNQGVTSVDLSGLPKGIYMVKMKHKTSKKMQMQKIVVR